MPEYYKYFEMKKYRDCDLITIPKENKFIYLVVSGQVNVIHSESMFHAIEKDIRKSRWKSDKQNKKKVEMFGQDYVNKEPLKFITDFPEDKYKNGDYKKIHDHHTFGNDKLITGKGYRPSFALAQGITTSVLIIPVHKIEDCIHKIANSGENLIKSNFFKKFDWFAGWSAAKRTKLLEHVSKVDFYRGNRIITEGTNEQWMYVIMSGTANLVKESHNNNELFKKFEFEDDPCRVKRHQEYQKLKQPYKK